MSASRILRFSTYVTSSFDVFLRGAGKLSYSLESLEPVLQFSGIGSLLLGRFD